MPSPTKTDWLERAQKLTLRTEAFIGGKFQPAASGRTFDNISPVTGKLFGKVAACDTEDVDRAVASARAAYESGVWSNAAPEDRKAVLLRLAGLVRDHLDELALLESMDMGKLVSDARTYDIPGAASLFQWYGEAIDKIYDEIAPTGPGNLALVRRQSLGVVGAVVPWNYPLDIATWKCAPALAAGNSVVLKPAEQSPLTALRLAELAIEAGLPEGVLNVVPGNRAGGGARPWPAYGCRLPSLHRIDRSGQGLSGICRAVEHEAGLAGMRRQVAQPGLCRCRGSGCRSRNGGLRHLLQSGRNLLGEFASSGAELDQGCLPGEGGRKGGRVPPGQPARSCLDHGRHRRPPPQRPDRGRDRHGPGDVATGQRRRTADH
jgi:hypothetical protein